MSRKLLTGALAAIAVFGTAPAFAQADAGNPPLPHQWGGRGPGPGGFQFGGFARGFGGKTVAGAPFTATVTSTHTQKLADGNTIANTTNGTLARDSQGRTRREMTLPAIGPLSSSGSAPHLAFISDPVAQTNFTLNMDKKTAQQFSAPQHGAGGPGRVGSDAARGPRPEGGRPNVTTQALGTKSINGISAEGTLVTHTIPAGKMGNAAAIVVTTERWYSADLQMVVSETRTDPRFGTTTYQLTNINRDEPEATLFAVPSGFAVTQGRGPGAHGARRGPITN
jgi:hypothetical protein